MVEIKTRSEVTAIRGAGQVVARVLAELRRTATVGTSLREMDGQAREMLRQAGARSSFLDYHPAFAGCPYPAVICTSVNDAIVHGIPDDYRLRDGDLVSVDFAAEVDGWHADAATSWVVGDGAADDTVLIDTARRALDAAIEVARPGRRIGDIAHVIGQIGRSAGYGIPPDFGGHGVGRAMHESPGVPNEGPAGRGYPLKPGLVIAIEPMFLAGGRDQYTVDRDGWTLRTADGSRAAHVEHTIAVMDDGPALVLTADS